MLIQELFELNEAFNAPAPFTIVENDDEEDFTANFIVGDKKMVFQAHKYAGWELEFAEKKADASGHMRHTFQKTGTGEEFKVFSTINAIIAKFIEIYKPKHMYFVASIKDKTRARLYKTLSNKLRPKGYSLIINSPDTKDELNPSVQKIVDDFDDDTVLFLFIKD